MAGRDEQGRGDRTQPIRQDNWSGGINSASQADELRDDEAQDIENYVYDADDNLISRVGVQQFIGSTTFTTRITSLHRYVDNSGTVRIIWTEDNDINRSDESGGGITDITGGLTLPTNTIWQWRTFTGLAIGVNRGTGANANPVKIDGANNAVALGGSPPKANLVEIWNSRVWLVDAVNVNRVVASALGNAEDYTTTGAAGRIILDIDPGDGDRITGLVEFRNSLFVFKTKKIHVISAVGGDATDPANLRVDIFTKNIGCVSPYSIQPVLNDVLYLSRSGVASLAQSEFGELKSTLISTKVAELAQLKNVVELSEISSMVLDDENEYWLSVPASVSPRSIPETYILHYDRIEESVRRWTRATGRATGTAFSEKMNGAYKEYLIAYQEGTVNTIYKYSPVDPASTFNDAGQGYNRRLLSKAYSANELLLRKDWIRFGLGARLLTEVLNVNVKYFFNNKDLRGGSFPLTFEFESEGLIWDVGDWDEEDWASEVARDEYVWRKFKKNRFGRKGVTITFDITYGAADQAFVLKYLMLEYVLLGHKRVRTK
jgi:hypothetical protein